MPFETALKDAQDRVERALDTLLPKPAAAEAPVAEAMRYATLGGGKRLRAFLVIESAALFGVDAQGADRAAAAIECVHAYSLVHDDLPCMDDDDLRRGKPTVHKAWDEATAVLAGDALQTCAFEILAGPQTHPDGAVRAELCLTLARAAGQMGMVGGQAADIAAESAAAPLPLGEIERLQSLKTGALIEWSCAAGAILGQADTGERAALARYAAALGRAFQIRDDILDVEGDADAAGKRLRKDADAGKATFVSHLGLAGAKERAAALVEEARAALAPFGGKAANLIRAAEFTVTRAT
ncbi:MAG: polyprenyl synthetase family protein [Rubricella sp.]